MCGYLDFKGRGSVYLGRCFVGGYLCLLGVVLYSKLIRIGINRVLGLDKLFVLYYICIAKEY